MDRDISILSEKQKAAYTMKQAGMSNKEIAAKMGVSPSTVGALLRRAERKFRDYDKYHELESKNHQVAPIDITLGELKIIRAALSDYSSKMASKAPFNIKTDWYGCLPYEADILRLLLEKVDQVLYGKPNSTFVDPPPGSFKVPAHVPATTTERILQMLIFQRQLIGIRMEDLIKASGFETQVMSLSQMQYDLWLYYFDKQISFGSLPEKRRIDLLRYLLYNLTAADSTPASLHHNSMADFPAYRAYMEYCFGIEPGGKAAFWLLLGSMPGRVKSGRLASADIINHFVVFMLLLEQYLMLLLPDGGFGGKVDKYAYDLLDFLSRQAGSKRGLKVFAHADMLLNPLFPEQSGQGEAGC